jgi:hypothetical protein
LTTVLLGAAGAIVAAVIAIIVREHNRHADDADADDALRVKSATYRHSGDATAVTLVVKNRSDSGMTLTGGVHLSSPTAVQQPTPHVLEGDDAGMIRDGGITIDKHDQRTLTFTVALDGVHGVYDLGGLEVVVHAGERTARAKLVAR